MAVKHKKEDVWIPTACNQCFNNCAIKVHRVDGIVVGIEGNPDSPVGMGHICGKAANAIMQLYDPNRKTKPMKRTNPKKGLNEDPGWVEISWDEAYDLAAEKIKKARANSPKSILGYSSITNAPGLLPGFVNWQTITLGGNFYTAGICGAAIHTVLNRYCGNGNAAPDYELCKYVIQFGTQAGTVTRHGTNMTANRFATARDNGCKFVEVDPHMSAGAEKADVWLPIRPGTDGALAMAFGYVIIHELGKYDVEYIKKYTNGCDLVDVKTGLIVRENETRKPYCWDLAENKAKTIDDETIQDKALLGTYTVNGITCKPGFQFYYDHVKTYTPEYAEKITTIPAAQIRQIAKELLEAACIGQTITIEGKVYPFRPAAVDTFSGTTRHKNSYLSSWAIIYLNILIGSLNVPGGYIPYAPTSFGYPGTGKPVWSPGTYKPDMLMEHNAMMYPGNESDYKKWERPVKLGGDYDHGRVSLQPLNMIPDNHLVPALQIENEKYKIKRADLFIVYAGNPLKNWGRHDQMEQFLRTFEYIILFDMFLSDTSYFADLFIPEAQALERYDFFPNLSGNHLTPGSLTTPWSMGIRQPVVEPRDGCPNAVTSFMEIAERLGLRGAYNTTLNSTFMLKEYKVSSKEKYTFEEMLDRCYKEWFGPDKGLEWFKKNGVLTWPRKPEEVYLIPHHGARVPVYLEGPVIVKPQVEALVKENGIPWGPLDNFQPLPGWVPCKHFAVTNPEYDLMPIYYTNALNVDSWGHRSPWADEINRNDPYGYTVEINRATAEAKGLKTGDEVIFQTEQGISVEGRLMLVEGIHPEVISVIGGSWGTKSKYETISQNKGTAICHLMDCVDIDYFDLASGAWDQCVRVKVTKKS
ncbi:molybdopterin-dependent oxidoreductase [Dehalobacter sp. DCM]|uniref:molybdopterin-dependent oxidoreductase n=1 Tax=Dehalobacter sp. DCM TaxID=2907827 RepID=UPI003081AE71|nr:molybdopterin-dependent oxidoreductase [Dehalobacter sp. DCM]